MQRIALVIYQTKRNIKKMRDNVISVLFRNIIQHILSHRLKNSS